MEGFNESGSVGATKSNPTPIKIADKKDIPIKPLSCEGKKLYKFKHINHPEKNEALVQITAKTYRPGNTFWIDTRNTQVCVLKETKGYLRIFFPNLIVVNNKTSKYMYIDDQRARKIGYIITAQLKGFPNQ